MRSTSLVQAKAHLSKLVDRAERQGQPTLICRHGKPAAAIVPVQVATAAVAQPLLSPKEASGLLDRMAQRSSSGEAMSLDEALGRSRFEH